MSDRRPVETTGSEEGDRRGLAVTTGAVLAALAFAVAFLRLSRLSELPPGIFYDEGVHGINALQALRGEHTVFFPHYGNGLEGLIAYAVALTTSLLGRTALAVRLPAALASAGTVFAVFWLGRALFGEDEGGRATPWRGLFVGGVAAALLAFSLSYTVIGRHAFRGNFLPLLLCLCFALVWKGWRERGGGWWKIALGGAFLGLVPYTYVAARFVPVLILLFGLSFLLAPGAGRWETARAELPRTGLLLGVAALVAAPLLIYFALHPEHFFLRSSQLWVLDSARSQGDPVGAALGNVWTHLLAFGLRGDPHWRHNFGSQPLLNPAEALFFWFGVGMALWRWPRPAYRLLPLWLGVMLLPPMLARDDLVPHYLRMIGAAPAAYLLIGVGGWEALHLLRMRSRAPQGGVLRVAAPAAIGCALALQGLLTYRTFFHQWAAIDDLYELYETELGDAASALSRRRAAVDTVYLVPYRVDGHPSFDYLYSGRSPAHVIHANSSDLARKVETILKAAGSTGSATVLDWKEDSAWTGNGDDNVMSLLGKYGRYAFSSEFAGFLLHTYTDVALDRAWTVYGALEPLAVAYDGGIALRGVALGQGAEQLSLQRQVGLDRERALWVALQWQTGPGLATDFAVSLRLYDGAGAMQFQRDAVLGNASDARTSAWSAGEAVDSVFYLALPDDIPAGAYELRLVVYDAETLTPTVEIDVWEPELVLARLQAPGTR